MNFHLSRIDPETGYDNYDPRDAPEPEEESDLEQARRRAHTCCSEYPNCDCAAISSELSRIHGVSYNENEDMK